MSFLVSNWQSGTRIPILGTYGAGGSSDDVSTGSFSAPPRVDWHCVPANLNLTRASVTQGISQGISLVPVAITPRLGGVDSATVLTLGAGQHSVVGPVSLVVPPVAVEADLLTNAMSAKRAQNLSSARHAWVGKFDDPFASWQVFANSWPVANATGVFGTNVTQHASFGAYSIHSQVDLETMPWPVAGTFKYLLAVTYTNPLVSAGPILTLGLEVAGVESIMVTTPTITSGNLRNLMLDTTTDVHVDAGDLVQLVARRTNGGTGSQINSGTRWYVSVGFLPD